MNIGDNIEAFNANWKFNSNTALNFEQHAKKSIPFYDIGHELIIKFSDFFIKNGSTIYELGLKSTRFISSQRYSRLFRLYLSFAMLIISSSISIAIN